MPNYRFASLQDGINNVGREDQIPSTSVRKAQNVDLLVAGNTAKVRRRKGYQQKYAGTNMHSAYATANFFLAVDGGSLKRWVDFDVAPLTIAAASGELSYVDINNQIIWSDGAQIAKVDGAGEPRRFGVVAPTGQPSVSAVEDGGLFAGHYQVAVTHLTSTGEESGTPRAAGVTVDEGEGIRLTNIPQPVDDEDKIAVYVSQANGETLYQRTTLPYGTTTHDLGYSAKRRALRTMFLDRMPASAHLAFYNGVLFAAVDETVAYSQPLAFAAYHTTQNFLLHDTPVNMLRAGDKGIFVGTESGVTFYQGNRPEDFAPTTVSPPAIPGASLEVDGGFILPALQGSTVVIWWTVDGVMMLGLPDGQIEPVRDTEFRIPNAERGALASVTREGVKQVVSVMKNPGTGSSMAFQDSIDIEVHRHGVTL